MNENIFIFNFVIKKLWMFLKICFILNFNVFFSRLVILEVYYLVCLVDMFLFICINM